MLIDESERERFVRGHDKNISVIAPAGVGKTTAIVDRIVHLAQLPEADAIERLSRLVVVTYSVRAAQEMQQRARVAIRGAAIPARVQRAFQQTFFGTIHSFCVRLLEQFGHYLGLPSPVALLQDHGEMWQRFLLRGLNPTLGDDPNLRHLFHFYDPAQLYSLGHILTPGEEQAAPPFPRLEVAPLLAFDTTGLHHGTKRTIVVAQGEAERWSDAWRRGERFRPLPSCPPSEKAAEYRALYRAAFAPLHHWLHEATRIFGRLVANAYERFRLAEAVMTYDDQVRLALRVLENPAAQRELAEEGYSVLLDEAQDTDPLQFEVLSRVAGLGSQRRQAPGQSFSIVGDFQQAIYAPRSDLATYRRMHDAIRLGVQGDTSVLRVTFRCDKAIIDFVNNVFPALLNETAGQCGFEQLVARNDAGAGQVVRLVVPDLPNPEDGRAIQSAQLFEHEAELVARQVLGLGYAGLGARNWSQVAILCPRKNWLQDVRRALIRQGGRVQLHSADETPGDRMSSSWLTALIWIAAHPEDSFEVAGVLREVLGIADSDMAIYTAGQSERLRLDRPVQDKEGAVGHGLETLRAAFANATEQPLAQTVRQMVETTQLRARLLSIPEIDPDEADRELEDILAAIAVRSAQGATLAELAHELRAGLTQPSPAEEEIEEDAIQMMTSHKAKGLEWDAVIVPYLFRKIEWKQASYPRVVHLGADDVLICRDKAEYDEQARETVTRRERQQSQRLYYVMLTRAKRTLVLFDDEALMRRQKPGRVGEIAGEFLGFAGGPNRVIFHRLSEQVSAPVATARGAKEDQIARATPQFPVFSAKEMRQAIARADEFPHRVTPHALAIVRERVATDAEPEKRAEEPDESPRVEASGAGILYGTWWHEFMQSVPWDLGAEAWDEASREAQKHSPQPKRATREWELFRQSELARWLARPGRLIQVEIPFLHPQGETSCLEGIIDLAVYDEAEKSWQVIDWKTNRIGEGGTAALVEVYRGQLEAYVRALREILGVEARGSLYLTATGEWVRV